MMVMDHVESMDIVLEEIGIVDWYDGVVIGIGRQQQQSYLIVLVAWDLNHSRRKAFLLLGIEHSVEAEFKRYLQSSSWDELMKLFNEVVTNHKRAVFLTFDEPEAGKTLSLTPVTVEVAGLKDHDVENTFTPEALKRWLGTS
jgi:alpha-ketoglutarate-dependent taurine dioxygenase